MSFKWKTLIVFDTNKLRKINCGGLSYHCFDFSEDYHKIENTIEENTLSQYVDLAVPQIVLDELLKQKTEQYSEDIKALKELIDRLSKLPSVNFDLISLPDKEFNCHQHLQDSMLGYIESSKIIKITLPDENLSDIFNSIIKRAIEKKAPFKVDPHKFSDKGFKDVLIWECILNFQKIGDYDKVILFSSDTGFKADDCKKEFEEKIGKFLSIYDSSDLIIKELKEDYKGLIRVNGIVNRIDKKYLEDFIMDQLLADNKKIQIENVEYTITNISFLDTFEGIAYLDENLEPLDFCEEERINGYLIFSLIKISLEKDGIGFENKILATTQLDDTLGYEFSNFEVYEDD